MRPGPQKRLRFPAPERSNYELHKSGQRTDGSCTEDHINRVFVRPDCQGKGYGSGILAQLEQEIFKTYNAVYLESSLHAVGLYEKRGYQTVRHEGIEVENGAVLVYEIMRKEISEKVTRSE